MQLTRRSHSPATPEAAWRARSPPSNLFTGQLFTTCDIDWVLPQAISTKPSESLQFSVYIWKFRVKSLAQETVASMQTCASYLRKFGMTRLQVEQPKLQVKSGVSWALLTVIAHRLRKKTFRNRTRSISDSWLSQVKLVQVCSLYATCERLLLKVAFESDFRKKLSNVS